MNQIIGSQWIETNNIKQSIKQSNVFGILKYYIQGNMQNSNMEFFVVIGILVVLAIFFGKLTHYLRSIISKIIF